MEWRVVGASRGGTIVLNVDQAMDGTYRTMRLFLVCNFRVPSMMSLFEVLAAPDDDLLWLVNGKERGRVVRV